MGDIFGLLKKVIANIDFLNTFEIFLQIWTSRYLIGLANHWFGLIYSWLGPWLWFVLMNTLKFMLIVESQPYIYVTVIRCMGSDSIVLYAICILSDMHQRVNVSQIDNNLFVIWCTMFN